MLAGRWRSMSGLPRRVGKLKLGIVGLGAIGRALAVRAESFGMEIAWTGPRPQDAPYRYVASLNKLAGWCDVLAVAARADAANTHMIGRDVLEALGPEGILINVARGSLVDEGALLDLLKSGGLRAAGLDVFEEEPTVPSKWQGLTNVVLTPHVAGATLEAIEASQQHVMENLRRQSTGQPLLNRLN